ncbi:MAG TPA: hypothetical protein QGF58_30935 [Myxococcota bacterium]|nr:hypothetical protein [Myxococcota bacterium]
MAKKRKIDKAGVARLVEGGQTAVTAAIEAGDVALALEAAVQLELVGLLQGLEGGPHRKLARKALHRLKSKGVAVETPTRTRTAFTLGSDAARVPPTSFVGPPSPEGYSEFFLAYTDEDGTCLLMGHFGGQEGLRGLSHGHLSRGQLRSLKKDLAANGPGLVELPFSEAVGHMLPALEVAKALTGRYPHEWDHFATHIPEGVMNSARLLDPLRGLERDDDDLTGTSVLGTHPWFQLWPVAPAAIEEVITKISNKLDDDSPPNMAEELSAAAGGALEGVRPEWIRRARLAASAARAAGDVDLAQTAAVLVKALETGRAASDIPLVERTLQVQIGWMAQQAMSETPGD